MARVKVNQGGKRVGSFFLKRSSGSKKSKSKSSFKIKRIRV